MSHLWQPWDSLSWSRVTRKKNPASPLGRQQREVIPAVYSQFRHNSKPSLSGNHLAGDTWSNLGKNPPSNRAVDVATSRQTLLWNRWEKWNLEWRHESSLMQNIGLQPIDSCLCPWRWRICVFQESSAKPCLQKDEVQLACASGRQVSRRTWQLQLSPECIPPPDQGWADVCQSCFSPKSNSRNNESPC